MHTAKGRIEETYLDGKRAARLACAATVIPAPGQYLLAHAISDPSAPLSTPVYQAGTAPGGFYAAPPLPVSWAPGTELVLRGPLGHGFHLPSGARHVALCAFGPTPARLLPLVASANGQNAEVALLTDAAPDGLPAAIEILPSANLPELLNWADYLALDASRNQIPTLLTLLTTTAHIVYAQILIETSLPCGGLAACGACAVTFPHGWKLACKDGPVFEFQTRSK